MLYKRIIKVDIGGLSETLSYPALKIEFKGEIDDDNESDIFMIKIFNLSISTINKIKKGADISLQAGYEDNFGTLNIGKVVSVSNFKNSTEYVTEIKMSTDTDSWTNDYINQVFNPPITSKQILERLVPLSGLSTGIINLEKVVTYQRGKAVSGKLIDVVKQIAKESATPITISNGKINFTNKQISRGFLISSTSGLISIPKKIDEKDSNIDYSFKILFNSNIKPKSLVKLESKNVNGNFEVVKATFNEDFTIDLFVKEV